MMKKVLASFKNLSIKYKLFIVFMFIILLSFGLFSVLNYYIVGKDAEKQAIYSSNNMLNQAVSFLENKLSSVTNVMNVLANDSTIQELTEKPASIYFQSIGDWLIDERKITRIFFTTSRNFNIDNISIYMKNGLPNATETDNLLLFDRIESKNWYNDMLNKNEIYRWMPSDEISDELKGHFSLIRLINDVKNITEYTAALRADISEQSIVDILNKALFTRSTLSFIVNSEGEVICASSNKRLYNPKNLQPIIKMSNSISSFDYKMERDRYYVISKDIENTDWKMILLIPYKQIHELNIKTLKQVVTLILIITPFILLITLFAVNSNTNRINKLIVNMNRVTKKGDFDINIVVDSQDEIGQLMEAFEFMIKKVKELLNEQYHFGKEIKSLELKALQAQINPHFLYNTLELINWMAIKDNNKDISNIVNLLSKFYKLSLSKGEDIVTVQSEIEHVKSYVDIQNYRFCNSINLTVDIPDEILKCKIPKITLQPIVENAIIHGILEKKEQRGKIDIKGYVENQKVILIIEDDGVGIPQEKLNLLKTNEILQKEGHGYGIKNINERLKIHFGADFGVFYNSKLNYGTEVRVIIPYEY